ncbi:MAG: hypothetical protein VR64_18055, partial [Desulfatitalea sp. BRH_c12]
MVFFTTLLILCGIYPLRADENSAVFEATRQARTAGISESMLNRLLAAGYRYKVDEKDLVRWIGMVQAAAEEDLPLLPLVDKMEEGLAKRGTPRRIDAVLAQRLDQLRTADRLIAIRYREPHESRPAAVERIADLLAAGLSPEEIRSGLTRPSGPALEERLQALTFLAVLKQSGLQPHQSVKIVYAGLQNQFFSEFPLTLAFMVKAAHARDIPEKIIADETMKVVRGQQSLQQAQRSLNIHLSQQPTALSVPAGGKGAGQAQGHGPGAGSGPGGPAGAGPGGSSSGGG